MCIGMHIEMCIDMCIDMCASMCVGMCTGTALSVGSRISELGVNTDKVNEIGRDLHSVCHLPTCLHTCLHTDLLASMHMHTRMDTRTHARTHAPTHAPTHPRTHARTHARTHTQNTCMDNTYNKGRLTELRHRRKSKKFDAAMHARAAKASTHDYPTAPERGSFCVPLNWQTA